MAGKETKLYGDDSCPNQLQSQSSSGGTTGVKGQRDSKKVSCTVCDYDYHVYIYMHIYLLKDFFHHPPLSLTKESGCVLPTSMFVGGRSSNCLHCEAWNRMMAVCMNANTNTTF